MVNIAHPLKRKAHEMTEQLPHTATWDDVKISTLMSYLKAMGGRLAMRVHFDDLDVSIDLPETKSKWARL